MKKVLILGGGFAGLQTAIEEQKSVFQAKKSAPGRKLKMFYMSGVY